MRTLLLVLVFLLSGCVPQAQLAYRGCNGVLASPTEIVTAAHCLPLYNGGETAIRSAGRMVKATPLEVDTVRDTARLALSESVFAPYYATYREPSPGATGFVIGGCPLRAGTVFRVMATERVVGSDGVARWVWAVRDGHVTCGGDSGSPIWSDVEPGVYYGIVSRYERLRMRIGSTLVLLDAGASVYSGAGAQ
jgi:hypothetical protein